MSEVIYNTYARPVTSLSIPPDDFVYVGQKISRVLATTDDGNIYLYNGVTPGLSIEPSSFDTSGTQTCKIYYKSSTTHGGYELISNEATIEVKKEEPVSLVLTRTPYKTSLRALDDLDICGAEFKVLLNSGRSFRTDFRFVEASLEGDVVTFTYSYNGMSVSATMKIQYFPILSLKASLTIPKDSLDEGDDVDTSCFKLEALFGDDTSKRIYDFEISPKKMEIRTSKIALTYGGMTTYVEIDPITDTTPDNIVSIKVKDEPTKTSYIEGDTLDLTGMTLTLTSRKGVKSEIDIDDPRISYEAPSKLTISSPVIITYKDSLSKVSCTHMVVVEGSSIETSKEIKLNKSKETTITASDNTSVILPLGSISTATENSKAQLAVATKDVSTDPETVVEDFVSSEVVDINLSVDGSVVSEFEKPVAVTISTLKGLTQEDLKVTHDSESMTITNYDSETGKLTFETTHFSLFTISSKASVVNTTTKTGYLTLESAVADAEANSTLKLLRNLDLTSYELVGGNPGYTFTSENSIILDLNTKEITSKNFGVAYEGNIHMKNGSFICANNGSYAIYIGNGGVDPSSTITLDNISCQGGINVYAHKVIVNSTISGGNTSVEGKDYYAIWVEGGAEAIVEGGTYTSTSLKGGSVLNSSTSAKGMAINNGTFIAENKVKIFATDTENLIKVAGGTFITPEDKFGDTLESHLLSGYKATEVDGKWVVSKKGSTEEESN